MITHRKPIPRRAPYPVPFCRWTRRSSKPPSKAASYAKIPPFSGRSPRLAICVSRHKRPGRQDSIAFNRPTPKFENGLNQTFFDLLVSGSC